MERKNLFKRLALLILFIFAVNFLANKFFWYSSIWYLDMIMHFLGGLWVGLFAFYIFKGETISFHLILKILLFVLFVGIGWEVYEILVDKVVTQNSFNILDTSSDLFFDLSGGLYAILYLWIKK
jgi:hypothetical protein